MADALIDEYMAVRDGMLKRDVGEQASRVLEELMQCSLLIGRAEAPIARLDDLAEASIIHRGNLRRVLDLLVKAEVLDEERIGGSFVFVIRPDWTGWRLPARHRADEDNQAQRARERLKAVAMSAPEQITLIKTDADMTTEISRAFAPLVVPRTTMTADPALVVRGTTRQPAQGITHARDARAREHDHAQSTLPTAGMLHDAPLAAGNRRSLREMEGEMDDESLFHLNEAREVGHDAAGKFRKTWAARLMDPGSRAAAIGAIGEVKHRQMAGERFNKGPGECMNDIFNRLRDAARKVVAPKP